MYQLLPRDYLKTNLITFLIIPLLLESFKVLRTYRISIFKNNYKLKNYSLL